MSNWWIVVIILLVVTVVLIIINKGKHTFLDLLISIFIILSLLPISLAIILPMSGEQNIKYLKTQRTYIIETIKNSKDLYNVSVTQSIIEYNSKLASAKAEKESFGNWGFYIGDELDSIEPILLDDG